MNDLKETAEQQALEAISEVLKSYSLSALADLSANLETLLGELSEASEHHGVKRSDIESTLEILAEAVEFAKEDIENS